MIAQLVWFVGVAFVTAIFAGISAKLPIPSGQIRRDLRIKRMIFRSLLIGGANPDTILRNRR